MVSRTVRSRRLLLAVMSGLAAVALAATSLAACSSSSSSDSNGESEFPTTPDASGAGTDARSSAGSDNDGGGPIGPILGGRLADVRFANLAPGLGSVDFCWAPTDGVQFRGPLLGKVDDADAQTDADAAPGITPGSGPSFPRLLAYQSFAVPLFVPDEAVLDIIAIPAGRGCDAPPLASAHFGTYGGYSTTIVLTSLPEDPSVAGLFAVTDVPFDLDSTAPNLRVVNAALLPDVQSLAATVTVDGTATSLGSAIVLGGTSPEVDGGAPLAASSSGYLPFSPTSSTATLALTFASADAAVPPVSIALGSPLVAQRFSTAYVAHDTQGFFVALSDDSTINASGSTWKILR